MTEQGIIELLQNLNVKLTDMAGHKTNGIEKIFGWNEITAICEAIKALEEVQQYRAIGTVEECRAAVEKQAEKKVFVVVQGNYALSKNMDAFSTRELAEGFRKHIRKESDYDGCINIFELEVDGAVLKEEDM